MAGTGDPQEVPGRVLTFATKQDADRWARKVESGMDAGLYWSQSEARRTTLGEIIGRFIKEVLPGMRCADDDRIRLKALMAKPISKSIMATLSPARRAEFRDERLDR